MQVMQLIGLPYRLGADPERHGAADCLSLSKAVLAAYGIETPTPQREWYRRLKRGDTSVFQEELLRWGQQTTSPRIGAVGLCLSDNDAKGLATFWEDGWIAFAGTRVKWSRIGALQVSAIYYPRNMR